MVRFLISLLAGAARFLLFGIAVLYLFRLLGRMLHRGAGAAPPRAPSGPVEKLVQDPVCGVRLPRDRALPAGSGAEAVYFCSEECRRRYEPADR